MNRIEQKFKELKRAKKKAFIAYITAGNPTLAVTKDLVPALERAGVDMIELGIPFSDPLADGPTIQAASQLALKGGVNLKKILAMVRDVRKTTGIPIVFMTYFNPVLKYGVGRFMADCRRSGVDGVIAPDLPCGEAKDMARYAKGAGVAQIFLAAPTSTKKSLGEISNMSRGFIYYVSLTGVTGARRSLPGEIARKVRSIKSISGKPVAVGFGVSTPSQAREIARSADGVIVGSALVKIIENNIGDKAAIISKVSKFAKSLAEAIHG